MDIIIREARASDYQDIALISKLDLGYEYPAELVQVKLEKVLRSGREKVFVAIVDGKTAGYIHAEDYDVLYYPQMKIFWDWLCYWNSGIMELGRDFCMRWKIGHWRAAPTRSG